MEILRSYKIIVVIAAVMAAGVIFTSCVYDNDRCDDMSMRRIKIVFDWERSIITPPEGMAVYFFPVKSGEIWRFDIASTEGGYISVPTGDYHMLVYNNDTYDVLFRNENSYEDYDAYTPEVELTEARDNYITSVGGDVSMHMCPDMLWADAQSHVDIGINEVVCGDVISQSEIVCYPHEICAMYRYVIKKVKNLDGVESIKAVMSGMSPSIQMSDGVLSTESVMLPVEAIAGDGTVSGHFCTFGRSRDKVVVNELDLYVVLYDGRKICYRFDVTRQVVEAPDPHNVSIVIDGLELPDSDSRPSQGALDVSVDGWTTVVVRYES